jgi:dTDP-3-amino-2,3,6-trideoxy-4-keto-D-glucose/dTDP-3-amino-3,4,6-trideoxy-alpha-D-glucose/dTDP-2,6-dideoxy-D-kanosamine transaminase
VTYKVPFVDPRKHYQNLKSEIDGAIQDCLTKGDLIFRQQLKDFEANFASFVGVKYAVGLNSGYHALEFSLRAAGISPGDEVITVAHTFVATVSAIVNVGAAPVLVEVSDDFNMDPDAFEDAITSRTKAVIPVSLNGRVCKMDRIMDVADRNGIKVVEDSAQAVGAEYQGVRAGAFGLTGCFSFYPFKLLGGFGDGGAITTNDPDVARMAIRLRYNGEDRETGEFYHHGQTALLDNVQAAVLDRKLRHVPEWIQHRRKIARLYCDALRGLPGITLPPFDGPGHFDVFQNFVIYAQNRDELRAHLRNDGIETLVSWPKPMWEHLALNLGRPHLPNTERICREVISLPMSAETTEEHVRLTVESIQRFVSNLHGWEHDVPQPATVAD